MIKKIYQKISFYLKLSVSKFFVLQKKYRIGSKNWLIYQEIKFGGFKTKLARNRVSKYDHRSEDELKIGGMTGGDRMLIHGYAKHYSKFLNKFINNRFNVYNILEIGVLQGTGLAIWSELFPNSNIYGADIDPAYFNSNLEFLKSQGAFKNKIPFIIEFDQLDTSPENFEAFKGSSFDIVIDDGLHSKDSIMNSLNVFFKKLNSGGLYIIEDVKFNLLKELQTLRTEASIFNFDQLYIIEKNEN
tara:strand:+ start:940 stop:1671 length:732 start_codon:yes stop_codon:yes gene_type:complete